MAELEPALEHYRAQLAGLDMDKGCIRFKRAADLPLGVLREIVAAGTSASGDPGPSPPS